MSACFAAAAVTPFETLRIKTVTVPDFPKTLTGAFAEIVSTGRAADLISGNLSGAEENEPSCWTA